MLKFIHLTCTRDFIRHPLSNFPWNNLRLWPLGCPQWTTSWRRIIAYTPAKIVYVVGFVWEKFMRNMCDYCTEYYQTVFWKWWNNHKNMKWKWNWNYAHIFSHIYRINLERIYLSVFICGIIPTSYEWLLMKFEQTFVFAKENFFRF